MARDVGAEHRPRRRRRLALLVSRSREASIGRLRFRLPSLAVRGRAAACHEPVSGRARRRGAAGPVVVIRVPQFELPRPNLLDLYCRAHISADAGACRIVGIMGLFYISTFLDKSDKLFKGQVTLSMMLAFLWWETPQFLYYIIAIAVLLAAIVTIGLLTKNSELIVMRACGISLYRTAVPLLVFAATASGVLFAFEERVLGVFEPPRGLPESHHQRRQPADLRRAEPQVGGRPQRRDLPLPVSSIRGAAS